MSQYPPRIKETVRPFRLWNPQEEKFERGRMYNRVRTAHDRATTLVRWMKVGSVIEVLDVRSMAWRGTYSRKIGSIKIETLRGVDSGQAEKHVVKSNARREGDKSGQDAGSAG